MSDGAKGRPGRVAGFVVIDGGLEPPVVDEVEPPDTGGVVCAGETCDVALEAGN